ncbi:MAG: helicase [Clostridia bacterium]|nr:helicase [Clostridia bacterium]
MSERRKRGKPKGEKRPGKQHGELLSRAQLLEQFEIGDSIIEKYLKDCAVTDRKTKKWPLEKVMELLDDPNVHAMIREEHKKKKSKDSEAANERSSCRKYLRQFTLEKMIEQASAMHRKFILHVGPTNSGKTYQALLRLKQAQNGVYLGPLRLLALEVFDNLNRDGIPCSLLTGEEREDIPASCVTASTIELCDFYEDYDVAVIDEAQMMADPARGAHWTEAILLIPAREVHICMAPIALGTVLELLKQAGAEPEIRRYERLTPLEYQSYNKNELDGVQPGDAVIVFSRRSVLQYAAMLERKHFKVSVIYGSLPPAARREEVRKFASGETQVVVATDAIGMGISLPIRRVLFAELVKYDGVEVRPLMPEEIKQIAGRAGRYKKYDIGYAGAILNGGVVRNALKTPSPDIDSVRIPFPSQALRSEFPLKRLIMEWQKLPHGGMGMREDLSEALERLKLIEYSCEGKDKEFVYTLISCPVDMKNGNLVLYWQACSELALAHTDIRKPDMPAVTLEECETLYKAYDVFHQMCRRIGQPGNCDSEKEKIIERINQLLTNKNRNTIR